MPNYPVTYVKSEGETIGAWWGVSTVYVGTDFNVNIPSIGASDVKPLFIFVLQGDDWRYGSTNPFTFYTDTAKTAIDTGWNLVFTNMPAVHEPVAVYYKTNLSIASSHAIKVAYDGAQAKAAYINVGVFDNARQTPSCDTIIGDVQYASTNSNVTFNVTNYSTNVMWYILAHDNDDFEFEYSITGDSDATQLWGSRWIQESTFISAGWFYGWVAGGDTTSYLVSPDILGVGDMSAVIFQIYPHEIDIQGLDGLISFGSAMQKKTSTYFSGTLSFVGNLIKDVKRFFTKSVIALFSNKLDQTVEIEITQTPQAQIDMPLDQG
jgi:hypothetical protein